MTLLLRDVSIADLASLFARHATCSPAPHLKDPDAVHRARRLARANGVWADLDTAFDPDAEIPVIRRSVYRVYKRTGIREPHQEAERLRRRELDRAAMALWLGHPKADLDRLQDLIWAYCDDFTWVMAAHERCAIDLGSAALAARLAELAWLFDARLEEEVKGRLSAELERRLFRPYADPAAGNHWKTVRMNWNHVCNGEFIRAALYQIRDPGLLANTVHQAIRDMAYALDGFTDDGGCAEGPGYWGYGFGHYVSAASALFDRTGGELNLMADEKIARICRYPLTAHIGGRFRATFGDAHHGCLPSLPVQRINRFHPLPGLYGLCAVREDGALALKDMHELALGEPGRIRATPGEDDALLPDLGMVKLRGAPGPGQLTLLAIAGHNAVPHNHNDVGSFMLHRGGRMLLDDPGGPRYTQKTFSPRRYELLFCNSRGHSLPVINGRLQGTGRAFAGTLAAENLNGAGLKRAAIDMTRAYPSGTVRRLVRRFALDAPANTLAIEDEFDFARAPRSLEEAFVTFENARVLGAGKRVRIGPVRGGLILDCASPGRFSVEALRAETEECAPGKTLNRIVFRPAGLHRSMTLRFGLR